MKYTLILCVLVFCSGCAYRGSHTFSNSRKLAESQVHPIPKLVFAPLVLVAETAYSPIAVAHDGFSNREDRSPHLSLRSTKAWTESKAHPIYKYTGHRFAYVSDLLLLPISGVVDFAYALTGPDREPSPDEAKLMEEVITEQARELPTMVFSSGPYLAGPEIVTAIRKSEDADDEYLVGHSNGN